MTWLVAVGRDPVDGSACLDDRVTRVALHSSLILKPGRKARDGDGGAEGRSSFGADTL